MANKFYTVKDFRGGMRRDEPMQSIPDNSLWTAENVRFDGGRIKPVLADKLLKSITGGANSAVHNIGYHLADASNTTAIHYIAMIANTGAANSGAIYYSLVGATEYGSTLTSAGAWSNGAGKQAGQVDKAGIYSYISLNTGVTNEAIQRLQFNSGGAIATISSQAAALSFKIFDAPVMMLQADNDNKLYWTDANTLNTWTSGQGSSKTFNFNINQIELLGSNVFVYLNHGIYRMRYVNLPTVWYLEQVSPILTSLDRHANAGVSYVVVPGQNVHYFISGQQAKSVFMFNGSSFVDIGKVIKSHMFALLGATAFGSGTIYPDKDEIWWYCADNWTSLTTERFYIYNYKDNAWSYATLAHQTSDTKVNFECITQRFYPAYPRFSYKVTNGGTNYHRVYECDNDTTNRIPAITTKLYDLGSPQIFKRLKKIRLYLSDTQTKDFTVRVDYADNLDSVQTGTSYTVSFGSGIIDIYPTQTSGRYFQLYITTASTSATSWALDSIEFEYEDRGFV